MEHIKSFLMWISGPVGLGVLGALIGFFKKLSSDANERKVTAREQHEEQNKKIDELTVIMREQLIVKQRVIDQHNAELKSLRKKYNNLEKENIMLRLENERLNGGE